MNCETIIATRKGSGRSKTLELEVSQRQSLGGGYTNKVERVLIERQKRDKEPLAFILKTAVEEEFLKKIKRSTMEAHTILLSLPHGREYTPATLRYTNKGWLVTDLSQEGRNLVFSWNNLHTEVEIARIKAYRNTNSELVANLMILDVYSDAWYEQFEREAELIARETATAHISLSNDVVFFVVYPDGSWHIVLGDLDGVRHKAESSTEELYQDNLHDILICDSDFLKVWRIFRDQDKELKSRSA